MGKTLATCHQFTVVGLNKFDAELPTVDLSTLRTDQQYLWEMTNAVYCDECSPVLAQRQPGTLNQSRWLTIGNSQSCASFLRNKM